MDSKLSNEMIVEILSRTSLKTLDTMRCMNREFDSLAYESYFLNLFRERNNIVSGFLVQNMIRGHRFINSFVPSPKSKNMDLDLPHKACILASSEQGLVVTESPNHLNPMEVFYHVCKPTTKQMFRLPNPEIEYTTEKVAIVVMGLKPLHFKIVRFSQPKCPSVQEGDEFYMTYNCEIFDSRRWAWSLIFLITLPGGVHVDSNAQPITARGSIYTLLTNGDILKFDAYPEKWEIILSPIPKLVEYECYTSHHVIKYKGKLGYACYTPENGCLNIWVLNGDQKYEKIYDNNKKDDVEWKPFMGLYDCDTSVMMEWDSLVFHKFKKGGNYGRVGLFDRPKQMFVFRSDFEKVEFDDRIC